jgi:hypothetical protein
MKKLLTIRIGLETENTAKNMKQCKQKSQVKQQYFFLYKHFIEQLSGVLKKQPRELNKNKEN